MAVVDDPVILRPPPPAERRPGPRTSFPNRVLLLVSSPLVARSDHNPLTLEEVAPLHIYEELECIADACRSAALDRRITFDLCVLRWPNIKFLEAITTPSLILHYIGHGEMQGGDFGLISENPYGVAEVLPRTQLRQILANIGFAPCKLAVLNACYSQHLADCLIDSGVQHVVAVSGEHRVLDSACRRFSSVFYPAILNGQTVASAFELARQAVESDPEVKLLSQTLNSQATHRPEHNKFRLLPVRAVIHDKPLTLEDAVGDLTSPVWRNTNLPLYRVDPFLGRGVEIHEISRALLSPDQPPVVGIHGMGGMGKTALADAVARWQHERSLWYGGVWFLPCRNTKAAKSIHREIAQAMQFYGEPSVEDTARVRSRPLIVLDDIDEMVKQDPDGLVAALRSIVEQSGGKILTTSRMALPGAIRYQPYDVRRLAPAASVSVFRSYLSTIEAAAQGENIQEDLTKVMEFLDGYAFAIRLAASYTDRKRLTIGELRHRLSNEAKNTLRYVNEPEDRESSLWATLELSYSDLHPHAKQMFCYLAAFPSGISADMASYVFGVESVELFEMLMLYSMAEGGRISGERRFYLPEPARCYANSKGAGDAYVDYGEKILEFYYAHAVRWARELADPATRIRAISQIDAERMNIAGSVRWGLDNEKDSHPRFRSGRIVGWLTEYTLYVCRDAESLADAVATMGDAIAACERAGDKVGQAVCCDGRGQLKVCDRGFESAVKDYEAAIELYRQQGNSRSASQCSIRLGLTYERTGDVERAIAAFTQAGRLSLEALTREAEQSLLLVNNITGTFGMYLEMLGRCKRITADLDVDSDGGSMSGELEREIELVISEAARMKRGLEEQVASSHIRGMALLTEMECATRMLEVVGNQALADEIVKNGAELGARGSDCMAAASDLLGGIAQFDKRAALEEEALSGWETDIRNVETLLLMNGRRMAELVEGMRRSVREVT